MAKSVKWKKHCFLRINAENFQVDRWHEKKMRPNWSRRFTEQLGCIWVPAPTNHNRKTGFKNADFEFKNPQRTKLAAQAVPNKPQLYPRLPPTIREHLGRGPPRTLELNFRSDFLSPPWDAPIWWRSPVNSTYPCVHYFLFWRLVRTWTNEWSLDIGLSFDYE